MPSTQGSAVSPQQQSSFQLAAQIAQGIAANGVVAKTDGYANFWAEVVETNGGTMTLTFEGSTDGINWFAIWAGPTAANGRTYAATFAVTASSRTWLKLQDVAPYVRARTSSPATNPLVTVNLYGNPI